MGFLKNMDFDTGIIALIFFGTKNPGERELSMKTMDIRETSVLLPPTAPLILILSSLSIQ